VLPSDLVLGFVLLDVAIILLVAHTLGALARRLGQPNVVGEIVAGVFLGPTLLGRTVFAWDHPWGFLHCGDAIATTQLGGRPSVTACLFPPQARSMLGILGQIAFILFLFLVGLELDWDLLKGKGKAIALVGVGVVAVSIGLGFLIGPLLYDEKFVAAFGTPAQPSRASFALMVGAMLSATAFPITARILQEKRLIRSPMGSIGIAAAATATVLVFLAVAGAADVATKQGHERLAVNFVLAGVYITALFVVVRPALAPLGRAYEVRGALTPGLFAAIFILLLASCYAADRIGINVIVGSFLTGVVMPARKELFQDMAARLGDLTVVVLLPVFLAFSGLNTDFSRLGVTFLPGIGLFLVVGIAGHWLGGAVFARLGGLSWAEGNVLGVLLNCRGLLVLVVALVAVDKGVISRPMQAGAVLMALVTTAMTGPLLDAFLPRVTGATPPRTEEHLGALPTL
jgi:Kef-type K+ transport system membrane component KefB